MVVRLGNDHSSDASTKSYINALPNHSSRALSVDAVLVNFVVESLLWTIVNFIVRVDTIDFRSIVNYCLLTDWTKITQLSGLIIVRCLFGLGRR